jgi:hypothetical protein
MKPTAIKWMARLLAAGGIVVCGFAVFDIVVERHSSLPFVVPGAPFGTYAQSTQVGIFTLGSAFALAFVGAVLAFRWESLAAKLLIAGAAVQIFLCAVSSRDTTRPDGLKGVLMSLLIFALPPLVTASLLLVHSRGSVATQTPVSRTGV